MPPLVDPVPSGVVFESDTQTADLGLDKDVSVLKKATPKKLELIWFNIFWFLFLHICSVYGLYLVFTSAKWQTNVFGKLRFPVKRSSLFYACILQLSAMRTHFKVFWFYLYY